MFKKAQADMRELALTLVIVGVVAIVGVLIFSNVTNVTEQILDSDSNTVTNESITVSTDVSIVVNESITMSSQRGNVIFPGIFNISFFGNGTNSTHLSTVAIDNNVNFTRSGRIIVDGARFDADGVYNISYIYDSNATGQTANEDVTSVSFFGSPNMSTHLTGIDVNDEVNFTTSGIISLSAINFTAGENNISYKFDSDSEAQTTINSLESTVLDSFSIGIIALIVLAAVVILSVLFKLGTS